MTAVVMAGLVPTIHVLLSREAAKKDVDAPRQARDDAGVDLISPGTALDYHFMTILRETSPMVTVREPILHTVPIAELRPTQITVGMREVHAKQKSWQQQEKKKKAEFLGRHMIPVIRGPKERMYV